MAVRLLPKSEIDKRKAEEQRLTIQEGLKVAERVDTLRETLASEETAFEKYRIETLRDIQAEIQTKHEEKEALEAEVITLRREKKELLIPLDAKWNEVNRAQKVCTEWDAELKHTSSLLTEKEKALDVLSKELAVKEGKAEDLKKLASAMFAQAENMVAHAKEDSADMRNKAQAELSLVELKKLEVEKREDITSHKETALFEKEKRIEIYEIDLAKREHTLRAGWKNLEATAKKLHIN